jgi:hypothetical protein
MSRPFHVTVPRLFCSMALRTNRVYEWGSEKALSELPAWEDAR